MRVQTEEWRRFIPGMRMYKGKMTLFYNGEKLWEGDTLIYSYEESLKWEVIIVLPGVEVIPEGTFNQCRNVKTVIMSDTVRRIEDGAFSHCMSLVYIRLSRNLEYIERWAFYICKSLPSIFIPPSCTEIGHDAFGGCRKLIILSVPQHTQLGRRVIANTLLIANSSFETNNRGYYQNDEDVNTWLKNINQGEGSTLHLACSGFNPPLENDLLAILKRQGQRALKERNSIGMYIGITPLQYLEANPNADIDEQEIVKKYILEMMGEVVEST